MFVVPSLDVFYVCIHVLEYEIRLKNNCCTRWRVIIVKYSWYITTHNGLCWAFVVCSRWTFSPLRIIGPKWAKVSHSVTSEVNVKHIKSWWHLLSTQCAPLGVSSCWTVRVVIYWHEMTVLTIKRHIHRIGSPRILTRDTPYRNDVIRSWRCEMNVHTTKVSSESNLLTTLTEAPTLFTITLDIWTITSGHNTWIYWNVFTYCTTKSKGNLWLFRLKFLYRENMGET